MVVVAKDRQKNTPLSDISSLDKLRSSEEQYQYFIQNSSEGIWRVELKKPVSTKLPTAEQIKRIFKYAYLAEANQSFASMYGVESVDKLLGRPLKELLVEGDPTNVEYLTAFIKSGYKLSGAESRERAIDGSEKIFLNSLVGHIENEHITRAWGTQSDITEEYRIVEALRRSEERLKLALDATHMGLWEWDAATNELMWTDELKRLFGLDPQEDITYQRYIELVHPEDRQALTDAIERAMQDGKPYTIEHRVGKDDSSTRWLMCKGRAYKKDGKVVRMVGITMDIDQRKKAEVKAIESEQRFRDLADMAPVLIWVADTTKSLTYFNKPWRDFTGRKPEDDLGDGWKEVIHPDDLDYCVLVYHSAFDNREPYRMEYRIRRYDGKYLWMLDKGAPRYSSNGDFLGFVGSMVEVEEIKTTKKRQKELEEVNRKLKQQSEQLIELSKSKDEFISLASHQLRTPATGVKQYIGMLLEGFGGELTPEQTKMLRTAYESNERQLRIIDDLLKVAHIDAGKVTLVREKTDLVKLTRDVLEEQADTFKKRSQQVDLETEHRQITAHIDAERIRMVIENLIDNASKYTPEGKKVVISLTRTPHKVTIAVKDEGVGIAKRDIPRLFHKFSRIDNALSTLVGGTGLGLYWVKKIVTLHKGTVDLQSSPNKGSTFTVTLPRKAAK